jgi:hypothetical protein
MVHSWCLMVLEKRRYVDPAEVAQILFNISPAILELQP